MVRCREYRGGACDRQCARVRILPRAHSNLRCPSPHARASTYHLFYNANEVIDLVTLQAALTFAGNGALALAAASIAKESAASPTPAAPRPPATAKDAADDRTYYASGLALCVALAAAVKYGSLATDLTLRPSLGAAAALVLLPTAALATDVALSQRR